MELGVSVGDAFMLYIYLGSAVDLEFQVGIRGVSIPSMLERSGRPPHGGAIWKCAEYGVLVVCWGYSID